MDIEKIEKWIKEAHEDAVNRGEYNCPECDGMEKVKSDSNHTGLDICPECNGTGIDPNKNIGELLMRIVECLGEANKAHREGRFAKLEEYKRGNDQLKNSCSAWKDIKDDMLFTKEGIHYFEYYIKDTHEDRIADVFIKIFDLCGYLEIDLVQSKWYSYVSDNIGDAFSRISQTILSFSDYAPLDSRGRGLAIGFVLRKLEIFCQDHNIPIKKHIEAKLAYNKELK